MKRLLKERLVLSLLTLLMPLGLLAQDIKVQGVVKDETGETVIGASVMQKGTTNGAVTDIDGNFSLTVPSKATLVVSYIGFTTQEIAVGGRTQLEITLKEDDQTLNEVVVVVEYIDGFFRHYKELGVDFIRMDFLSWYEDGKDRGAGTVGRGYGREAYARALAYIAQSAKKYGVFTSLVMPHLNNDAEVEARYGNMVRIVADTGNGGWRHTSAHDKGRSYTSWPNCMNQFDGFTYWSHITGRNKVILDGDFLRLSRYETDAERQTAVSLQLMAGGPVAVADQPSTIGNNLGFYINDELLQLRRDGFVGQPLSDKLGDGDSEVWYGSLSNGNYVVALFNRGDQTTTKTIAMSQLGISGEWKVRDLWQHADEGMTSTLSATLPAHGCKVVMLTK